MVNINEKWKNILAKVALDVSAISFDLWIKPIEPLDYKEGTIILSAPSGIAKTQVQKNFMDLLTKIANEEMGTDVKIELLTPVEKEEYLKYNTPYDETKLADPYVEKVESFEFNPKYTFENFVVGQSNRFVYVACKTIAENPSTRFNPLFIYGGVGLGKTHLLHAIGNYINKYTPKLKIMYVTCENLLNDYVEAIRFNSSNDRVITNFRDKYRNVDVLMVDDIQFISKKTSLQEEIFHTFNDLYLNKKQIIFSSDRPPKEISTLDERLKSRFSSGLTQDVQAPDFETRLAILRKKAIIEQYDISDDALNFIADRVDTNIREMEGFLSKVVFFASLKNKDHATLEDAMEALDNYRETTKETLDANKIISVVTDYFNLSKDDIIGKKKTKEIVSARQVCIYLITELLDLPLTAIGELFGGRDHTTIIHSRDKIAKECKEKASINVAVTDLKSLLTESIN